MEDSADSQEIISSPVERIIKLKKLVGEIIAAQNDNGNKAGAIAALRISQGTVDIAILHDNCVLITLYSRNLGVSEKSWRFIQARDTRMSVKIAHDGKVFATYDGDLADDSSFECLDFPPQFLEEIITALEERAKKAKTSSTANPLRRLSAAVQVRTGEFLRTIGIQI